MFSSGGAVLKIAGAGILTRKINESRGKNAAGRLS